MFNLKKSATAFLLLILTIATCFIFTGCKNDADCRNGYKHHFSNSYVRCLYCDKTYCEAYGHSYNDDCCEHCGETKTQGCNKSTQKDIPYGMVIGFGIGLLIVGLIAHFIGIQISSPFLMRAPIVVFFFTTIAVFFQFGILCGIIMLICLIIYTVISVGMNRKYLDYDDIF